MRIFGIVNITADSFSDGGLYLAPHSALAHARQLLAGGADVVDLGAASSNPDAQAPMVETEIDRLQSVVLALQAEGRNVSIDSCRREVQEAAIGWGVRYLNDINGFADPLLYERLSSAPQQLIVMHKVQEAGVADRRAYEPQQILERICRFFDQRLAVLQRAGVEAGRLILDPGMGFFLGAAPENSLLILRSLQKLRAEFPFRWMISVSRKSFLGALTGREPKQRGAATLAAEIFAVESGVDFVRTHDAAALRDALLVRRALLASESEQ